MEGGASVEQFVSSGKQREGETATARPTSERDTVFGARGLTRVREKTGTKHPRG